MDAPVTVEVTNIRHAATHGEVRAELTRLCGGVVLSFSHAARSGKATIELPNRKAAEAAVHAIIGLREPIGFGSRGLGAQVAAASAGSYVEAHSARSWPFHDASATTAAEQRRSNDSDEQELYNRLPDGPMRDSLMHAVGTQLTGEGRVIKEFYLAIGRPCELVFAGGKKASAGGTHVLRSAEKVGEGHLAQFGQLFEGLSVN